MAPWLTTPCLLAGPFRVPAITHRTRTKERKAILQAFN